ncbi:MAG: hypothetical protein HZB16_03765 [Armatimonadetes bacterium]|nr:hypothetical protein [Armatimonadota bacterium]
MADAASQGELAPEMERMARFIVDRGLATPAVLFLGLHRPLAHLSSQALVVSGGVLAPLMGMDQFRALHDTLADQDHYDAFLDRLETLTHAEDRRRDTQPTSRKDDA